MPENIQMKCKFEEINWKLNTVFDAIQALDVDTTPYETLSKLLTKINTIKTCVEMKYRVKEIERQYVEVCTAWSNQNRTEYEINMSRRSEE